MRIPGESTVPDPQHCCIDTDSAAKHGKNKHSYPDPADLNTFWLKIVSIKFAKEFVKGISFVFFQFFVP